MIILDMEQRSPEWFADRAGVPTASSFDKIVTSKGEPSKQAKDYILQLAGEKIIGKSEDSFTSVYMQIGTEREAEAREAFQLITDMEVKEVGFCMTDDKSAGCSPDGIIDPSYGLEIKCPKLSTHIGYLFSGTLPTAYLQQVQGSMFVTGREAWYFMSYYPGIKPFILKVERDEGFISKLETALAAFAHELAITIRKIKEIG